MSSWKESWNASQAASPSVAPCGQAGNDYRRYGMPSAIGNAPTSNPWTACFKKYATFSGRARRKEYWGFILINTFMYVLIAGVALAVAFACAPKYGQKGADTSFGIAAILCLLYSVFAISPSLSVTVRRLHDTGRSGWFMLISMIPVVGPIVFFVTMLLDSQPGENRYGPNPKIG